MEIEISNLLDKGRYAVFNTQYYFDEEEKQGRDIDIYAMPLECHPLEEKLAPFIVRTELAIECKKSETHAWIFYTRPRLPMSSIHMSGQYRTSVPEPEKFSTESFQWLLKRKFLDLLYDKFERIAVAYDEIKIKKTSSSARKEIFEAVNQLVKFTCYEMHQIFRRISKTSSQREFIIIFFPIVVFDGDMFEANFDSGEPILERKNHILLKTRYRCPHYEEVDSFTLDIVHRSYFSEFMKKLETYFYVLRELMLQNYDELVNRARETRKKYVEEKGRILVEKHKRPP